jgi:hypothetical protein
MEAMDIKTMVYVYTTHVGNAMLNKTAYAVALNLKSADLRPPIV